MQSQYGSDKQKAETSESEKGVCVCVCHCLNDIIIQRAWAVSVMPLAGTLWRHSGALLYPHEIPGIPPRHAPIVKAYLTVNAACQGGGSGIKAAV